MVKFRFLPSHLSWAFFTILNAGMEFDTTFSCNKELWFIRRVSRLLQFRKILLLEEIAQKWGLKRGRVRVIYSHFLWCYFLLWGFEEFLLKRRVSPKMLVIESHWSWIQVALHKKVVHYCPHPHIFGLFSINSKEPLQSWISCRRHLWSFLAHLPNEPM